MKHHWTFDLKVGSLVKSPSGVIRVVRQVSHRKWAGVLTPSGVNLYFTIRRCSWTHACYTVVTGNDLVQAGYTPIKRYHWRKWTEFDRQIAEDFGKRVHDRKLTCCDVQGIA